MRLAAFASCFIVAAALVDAGAAGATPRPLPGDWRHVAEAQERLAIADYAAAEALLARVPAQSEAARDAGLLRAQLDAALAPRLELETRAFFDTQPLDRLSQRAGVSFWPAASLELQLRAVGLWYPRAPRETTELRSSATPAHAVGGLVGLLFRPARADLDVSATGLGRIWADGSAQLSGSAAIEGRWLSPVRLRASARRDELLDTHAAIREHVFVTAAGGALAVDDWNGWSGELRGEGRWYSDSNRGLTAYGWAVAPVRRGALSLKAGWGAAWADTSRSRWSLAAQAYAPYFTPLGARRHGPIVVAALSLGKLRVDASGDVAVQGSELDPTALAWGVTSRVDGAYVDLRAGASLDLGGARLGVTYHHNHQLYYRFHDAAFRLELPL
ncbi:hypothetical protein BE21_01320 [Sorangium cellulosum]|uniref:Secreted protein n=1 Tax=Sorangium cellulosum TaxID=56 RepID=A0A150TZD5_SORCE|nr:hypothetical protein BE21_01320 [Sorangium cellulosum]